MAKKTAPTAATDVPSRAEMLERARSWSNVLLGGPVAYYPVRHHSPACSFHLRRWIEQHQPQSIIVEGPCSLNSWLKPLVADDCVGPVAILMTYGESKKANSLRHSAFFPLCDYSPEWVAIREGTKLGVKVQFADLEFADKIRFEHSKLSAEQVPRSKLGVLQGDENNLRYSQFIERLTRKMGCRDFDELWDHLFEANSQKMTTEDFVGMLATWCDLSRASQDPVSLVADATHAREAVMVEVIRKELKRLKNPTAKGSILVVTGGFHTVVLPELVNGKGNPHKAKLKPLDKDLTGSWLIRYSYDQLDALNGYRSGMRSPQFYDCQWQAGHDPKSQRRAVANLVSTIARLTRGQSLPHEASVTDSIAAVSMLDQLADLRGHATPTRNDLLDAIFGCMRKESQMGNDLLAAICQRTLAGDRIGSVPPSVGVPPIVADFARLANSYRLPINSIEPKKVTLEIYRKPAHRSTSFLLHQLSMLGVPFASLDDGPDFVNGFRLSKLREEWTATWSPTTEARLAEMATFGETVASATARYLMQLVEELAEDGASRNASSAIDLLIKACRCGLHQHAREIVAVVETHLAEDGVFATVAGGLSRLALLKSAREPLEAERLDRIDDVLVQCYRRSCHLIDSLPAVPDDLLSASLDGLLAMRELLMLAEVDQDEDLPAENLDPNATEPSKAERNATEFDKAEFDAQLFYSALQRIIDNRDADPPRSEIAGAAAGLLHSAGHIDEARVCQVVRQYLDAAVEDIDDACGVVRGLMTTARESFWRMDELLRAIDELFARWEETRFTKALPHMRLAFAQLSPREIDLVAERVADLNDVEELGNLINPDVTEEEVQFGAQLSAIMLKSLREDGLIE